MQCTTPDSTLAPPHLVVLLTEALQDARAHAPGWQGRRRGKLVAYYPTQPHFLLRKAMLEVALLLLAMKKAEHLHVLHQPDLGDCYIDGFSCPRTPTCSGLFYPQLNCLLIPNMMHKTVQCLDTSSLWRCSPSQPLWCTSPRLSIARQGIAFGQEWQVTASPIRLVSLQLLAHRVTWCLGKLF